MSSDDPEARDIGPEPELQDSSEINGTEKEIAPSGSSAVCESELSNEIDKNSVSEPTVTEQTHVDDPGVSGTSSNTGSDGVSSVENRLQTESPPTESTSSDESTVPVNPSSNQENNSSTEEHVITIDEASNSDQEEVAIIIENNFDPTQANPAPPVNSEMSTSSTDSASEQTGGTNGPLIRATNIAKLQKTPNATSSTPSESPKTSSAIWESSSCPSVNETCISCNKQYPCTIKLTRGKDTYYICSELCLLSHRAKEKEIMTRALNRERPVDTPVLTRSMFHCAYCTNQISNDVRKSVIWEEVICCSIKCLEQYQQACGARCEVCQLLVAPVSLGKYAIRFGQHMKQFCLSKCLDVFKKRTGTCMYCQKHVPNHTNMVTVSIGGRNQYREFCSSNCKESYTKLIYKSTVGNCLIKPCHVCAKQKLVTCEVMDKENINYICSSVCFAAFGFVHQNKYDYCDMCNVYFVQNSSRKLRYLHTMSQSFSFCSNICFNVYLVHFRKIIACNWCKVKKYNFDMIHCQSGIQFYSTCSVNCYKLLASSTSSNSKNNNTAKSAVSAPIEAPRPKGNSIYVKSIGEIAGAITQNTPFIRLKPPSATNPVKIQLPAVLPVDNQNKIRVTPVIPNVTVVNEPVAPAPTVVKEETLRQIIFTRPKSPVKVVNKVVQTSPNQVCKAMMFKPRNSQASTQTNTREEESSKEKPNVVFIPVPVYIPVPVPALTFPLPTPLPVPIPTPVPVFIPTTKNSYEEIMKDIKRIRETTPSDPFEAELLVMAEAVAKRGDADKSAGGNGGESSSTLPDDGLLQMALKLVTEMGTSNIDPHMETDEGERVSAKRPSESTADFCGKKRRLSTENGIVDTGQPCKTNNASKQKTPEQLKYMFGINAWKLWSKATPSLFPKNNDILQFSNQQLSYLLSRFVQEVKKPDGSSYPPDTIYYFCLGIQLYLTLNGRVLDIFMEPTFKPFAEALDSITSKFSMSCEDSNCIVTRVIETHLWECKQLGPHSPYVLLNTLVYLNTKHFSIMTAEDHSQLSLNQFKVMSNKLSTSENGPQPQESNSKSVLVYVPLFSSEIFEVEESDNEVGCHVRLFEFYLSKCPESVRQSKEIFYLEPEQSCVPDSPVWYTTLSLQIEDLRAMFNRIKTVKEIVSISANPGSRRPS